MLVVVVAIVSVVPAARALKALIPSILLEIADKKLKGCMGLKWLLLWTDILKFAILQDTLK
jgi:hypothetical protein